jgi:hypothetical protein
MGDEKNNGAKVVKGKVNRGKKFWSLSNESGAGKANGDMGGGA